VVDSAARGGALCFRFLHRFPSASPNRPRLTPAEEDFPLRIKPPFCRDFSPRRTCISPLPLASALPSFLFFPISITPPDSTSMLRVPRTTVFYPWFVALLVLPSLERPPFHLGSSIRQAEEVSFWSTLDRG